MRAYWSYIAGLLLLTVLGCAEERPPIDRVQPFALKKSHFIGEDFNNTKDDPEFWTQGTLIDVGYGASQGGLFTSTYAQPMSRIKWQITEDLLIGRISFERIDNSDGKGLNQDQTKGKQDGVIAVAFRIVSHFDIINAYNPTTGEELNIRQENMMDRPWYEREYVRVDWSQNLNLDSYDFDTLSLLGVYGGLRYEPMRYDVTDPKDPDAPLFDLEEGYFDVTTKAFVKPKEIDLSSFGWGIDSFPACFLDADFLGGSGPSGSCNPVELTIRHSFKRVVDTDFEPQDWDGFRFSAFGAFNVERTGYARNYGMVDAKWRRFITRYNIWQRSHYYDAPEAMEGPIECNTTEIADITSDDNHDGTVDVCEAAGSGSRCNIYRQRCTLPFRDRKIRPVIWYYTVDSDLDYYDASEKATHEWDMAMRLAVRSAQYAECVNTTKDYNEPMTLGNYIRDDFKDDLRTTVDSDAEYNDLINRFHSDFILPNESGEDYLKRIDTIGVVQVRQLYNQNQQEYYQNQRNQMNTTSKSCASQYPLHFGQQDQNESLVALGWEVKACIKSEMALLGYPLTFEEGSTLAQAATEEVINTCRTQAIEIAERRNYEEADALVSLAMMDPIIILCHSPVEVGDHPYCGTENDRLDEDLSMVDCQLAPDDSEVAERCSETLNVRMGDLRYHQVNVMKHPQTPSPWGIYTDAEDPVTGETISASINVWGHVNDLWSQKVIDVLRYMKGELTTSEVTEGKNINQWALAAEQASRQGMAPKMTKAQRDNRIVELASGGQLDAETLDQVRTHIHQPLPENLRKQAFDLKQQLKNVKAHISAPSHNQATYMARAQNAYGSEVEAELFDPMVQEMMGVSGLPISPEVLNRASLLRGGNPMIQRNFELFKEAALAERGSCILHEAPAPHGFSSLAEMLERKFGAFNPDDDESDQLDRAEKMRSYLARRAHYAVIVHEMGHSVGLRHNFVSSSDAFNYRPQYWQLRTKNGAVTEVCEDLSADGENCVGPRYFDPMTKNETEQGLWMWMHSSVMDYAGEPTQDMLGLGAYDFAAARSFYGDIHSVYRDDSFAFNNGSTFKDQGILSKMDSFGGILGFDWDVSKGDNETDPLHYSQLNNYYGLIDNCKTVNPSDFRPSTWDDKVDGKWEPTFDGLIVKVNGQYSRCQQPKVDYRHWDTLRRPAENELNSGFYRGGNAISLVDNRVRVPYGFGTDGWADTGNLSVYRHDNGADPYELFDFFITQQEVNHIFDNYRRGRQSFSVRRAAGRTLGRYNSKMRDGAKGLGLLKSIYRDFVKNLGYDFDTFWAALADDFFDLNLIASGIAFDHFARQLARPEDGAHFLDQDFVLRSTRDAIGIDEDSAVLNIPNGATGLFATVGIGGRPIENGLAQDKGEFDSWYTQNAGSYYDKMYTPMLMTESVDNFISSDRSEFVDGRFRSISMADLFPEGYRRWLANNLTGDDDLKGPKLKSNRDGDVEVDENGYPTTPIGWVSWWGSTPRVCFPGNNAIFCDQFGNEEPDSFGASQVNFTVTLDPQVGWEQQKFLISWTMMYLPENQQQWWIDQLRLWEFGVDTDPQFENRIEFHYPEGKSYVAKTFGTEKIFGKTVQRGIAARVLEYANDLLVLAYQTTNGPDLNNDGKPDWYIPVFSEETGRAKVLYDPTLAAISALGGVQDGGTSSCNRTTNEGCTCSSNRACTKLRQYVEVPYFLRQALDAYGLSNFRARGIY
jgi:hypothetical protein